MERELGSISPFLVDVVDPQEADTAGIGLVTPSFGQSPQNSKRDSKADSVSVGAPAQIVEPFTKFAK